MSIELSKMSNTYFLYAFIAYFFRIANFSQDGYKEANAKINVGNQGMQENF